MKKIIALIVLLLLWFDAHSQNNFLRSAEEQAINLLKTQIVNLRGDSARLHNQIIQLQGDTTTTQGQIAAQQLLTQKFDAEKTRNAVNELSEIGQQSQYLEKLRKNLENYGLFNDGLKKVIEEIVKIDENRIAGGIPSITAQKRSEILTVISKFMFDYDFRFSDYPYLSEVINEIMIRKYGNVDENISDLLNRLQ